MYIDLKEDFKKWLVDEKGLSIKVAGNVLCRCKRLNNEILQCSIDQAVSTPQHYLQALIEVGQYAVANSSSNSSRYAMTGSLRCALKKYCEYRNPNTYSFYPTANSIPKGTFV